MMPMIKEPSTRCWRGPSTRFSHKTRAAGAERFLGMLPSVSPAFLPSQAVRALSGQPKGSCRGPQPSGGTVGERGRPQPKPRDRIRISATGFLLE